MTMTMITKAAADTGTATTIRMADLSIQGLCALLHLASPQLPVGGFSYSQGLEAAIEHGLVTDAGTARTWIADALAHGFARCEAPLWLLLRRAWGEIGRASGRERV